MTSQYLEADIRNFPRLLREFIPLFSTRTRDLRSAEAKVVLKEKFNIDCTIYPQSKALLIYVDEPTYVWMALKWK
jgi:hypothetical protein